MSNKCTFYHVFVRHYLPMFIRAVESAFKLKHTLLMECLLHKHCTPCKDTLGTSILICSIVSLLHYWQNVTLMLFPNNTCMYWLLFFPCFFLHFALKPFFCYYYYLYHRRSDLLSLTMFQQEQMHCHFKQTEHNCKIGKMSRSCYWTIYTHLFALQLCKLHCHNLHLHLHTCK